MPFELAAVQSVLRDEGIDGWLLYDFRGNNPLARRVLDQEDRDPGSRRWVYWVPASGTPVRVVHRIEDDVLDSLPGSKQVFLSWQEFEAAIQNAVSGSRRVAMEYSPGGGNPYIARVDAGTVELVRSSGVEVVSSGDLIARFEATWTAAQWQSHQQASIFTNQAFDVAWKLIAKRARAGTGVEEAEVRDAIMRHFDEHGLTTYHPPIVARGAHSGQPHYETGMGADCRIREGDLVLVDLWAKLDQPGAVYSDLTRMAYVGTHVPEKYEAVFQIVAAARDAGIQQIRDAFASGTLPRGCEVDQTVRSVIEQAGYGEAFTHRTGHSIGQEVHGNGAHIDGLETRDDRRLLPQTCFSIEPGIYLEEFGIRSEVDVYLDASGTVHVTGGLVQSAIIPLL